MSAPSVVTFAVCPVPSCVWEGTPQVERETFDRSVRPTQPARDRARGRSRVELGQHLREHLTDELIETIQKRVLSGYLVRELEAQEGM